MTHRTFLVLLGLALMAVGCAERASEPETADDRAPDSLVHISSAWLGSGEIVVEPLVARPLADTLILSGEIQPDPLSVTHVSARVAGTILRVQVVAGDRVGRGQVLATVYSPEFQALVADYLLAHERAKRAAESHDPDASSLRAVAQSSRRRLETIGVPASLIDRLQGSPESPTDLPLVSPAAGLITEVEAAPGRHVEAGADLFGIADLSSVWAVAHVYERDLARLELGQAAQVIATAYPARTFSARVVSMEGVVDPSTRTLDVRLRVTNSDLALRPGMFVSARIVTGSTREALIVSEGAIQDLGSQPVIFVATSDTTFVARAVTTRALGGNLVEILGGVGPTDRVATTGAFLLKSQALKHELGEE